jgi:hypothetical protein
VPIEGPKEVIEEFRSQMNDLAGTHAMCLAGLVQFNAALPDLEPQNRNEGSMLFVGHGDPNSPEGFAYQRWRYDDLPKYLDPDGPIVRSLGQQWVVMVTAQWEGHFRQRLADAKGIDKNDVKGPFLADLNRMRNDIIHHGGVATSHNTGRCEKFKWFAVGDTIHPMAVHIAEFMAYLGLVEPTDQIEGGGDWETRRSY